MSTSNTSPLGRLVHPAVDASPRASLAALAFLRVLAGLLWLYNVRWKRPPDFGKSAGSGLYSFTSDAVDHPVFPPYSWVVEHLVLPNFTAFGWLVLVVETALAVLLLTGTLVRLAALIGVAQSLAITLSVAQTPGEWPWSYFLMIGIHLVLLFTAAGAVGAVDAVRARRSDAEPTPEPAARLLGVWGAVAVVVALVGLVRSIGQEPTASTGQIVGAQSYQASLGSYNLLGAVVLLLVGALMLAATGSRRPPLAWAATVVAVLAAVSLYAQLGRAEVWLGGTNASAAFFVCTAVIAGSAARSITASAGQRRRVGVDD